MATGNQVLPEAPGMAAHTVATGQAVAADQVIRGEQAVTAGQSMTFHAMAADQAARSGQSAPGLRRGAGGRWLVWVLRAVVWAVLLLIGFRGVAAIVVGIPLTGGSAGGPAFRPGAFPIPLAQAFALEFGQVYLNYNPAAAPQRASTLALFLPPGADTGLDGGTGVRVLQSEQVAGVRVLGEHSAVVTVLARVNGHLIELGVPIYAAHGGIVVSGQPALLPAPTQATLPAQAQVTNDPAVSRALSQQLPAFFRAFASGDAAQLSAFAASGTQLLGLGGLVAFSRVDQISVAANAGASRHVVVTVAWRATGTVPPPTSIPAAPPAQFLMTYAMTVVRHGDVWKVRSIGAAAPQPWPPS